MVVFVHRILAVSSIRIFAVRSSAEQRDKSLKTYSLPFHITGSSSDFLFNVFSVSASATCAPLA